MPPYATQELQISIHSSSDIPGIALVETISGNKVSIPKLSDGTLGAVKMTRGTIRRILLSADFAESLLLSGGGAALSVSGKVQELVHAALLKKFPGRVSQKLSMAYED